MSQPQNCPKCGSTALDDDRIYRWCKMCGFTTAHMDWEYVRYIPSSVPEVQIDEPTPRCTDCGRLMQLVRPGKWQCDPCEAKAEQERKPRRMRSNPSPNRSASHWSEHDETDMCAYFECRPVDPTPENKPRRIQACSNVDLNAKDGRQCYECKHSMEHFENGFCKTIHPKSWCHLQECRPVDPTPENKPRQMQANDKAYHLSSHRLEHEEGQDCRWLGCRPVELTPAAPEWEDVPLKRNEDDLLTYRIKMGLQKLHIQAVSEPGFMGYVYSDGMVYQFPCVASKPGGDLEFPTAWRKRKGGA